MDEAQLPDLNATIPERDREDIGLTTAQSDSTDGSGSVPEHNSEGSKGRNGEEPRYQIIRSHAKGGLGEVFIAHDAEVGRDVALKEIKGKAAQNSAARSRFLREAEITGRLEHPGIVPVYGLGFYADGRPYYAMRFIQGKTLRAAIAELHVDVAQQRAQAFRGIEFRKMLQQFIAVCNTLEYAHSRGIIHRDLKPSNIMIGKHGETLVVDWGLAKRFLLSDSEDMSGFAPAEFIDSSVGDMTIEGAVVGTPSYMSPEQAHGQVDALGPAADVYSLGACLYEMLTGRSPIIARDVREALDKVRRGEFLPPQAANRHVPRGLAAICEKAMAPDPADRYHSAAAIAADLERWLADEPVEAWREPLSVTALRWCRRHRLLVTASCLTLAAAIVLSAVAWRYQDSLDRSRTQQTLLKRALGAETKVADAQRQQAETQRVFATVHRLANRSQVRPAGWTWDHQKTIAALQSGKVDTQAFHTALRSELLASLTSCDVRPKETLLENFDAYCMTCDREGNWLAVGALKSYGTRVSIKLIHLSDRKLDRTLSFGVLGTAFSFSAKTLRPDGIRSMLFTPDGKQLLAGTRSGLIYLFQVDSTESTILRGHTGDVTSLSLAPDGRVLSSSMDGTVRVWNLADGQCVETIDAKGPIYSMAHAGAYLCLAPDADGHVLDLQKLAIAPETFKPRTGEYIAAFPDGNAVFTGVAEAIGVWSPLRKCEARYVDPRINRAHSSDIDHLTASPRGRWLASTDGDSVKVWDAATREVVSEIPCTGRNRVAMQFHPTRPELFVFSNRSVQRYDLHDPTVLTPTGFVCSGMTAMNASPDGGQLSTVSVADTPDNQGRSFVRCQSFKDGHSWETSLIDVWLDDSDLSFSPRGDSLLVTDASHNCLRDFNRSTGELRTEVKTVHEPMLLEYTTDGSALWCVGRHKDLVPGLLSLEGLEYLATLDPKTFELRKEWSNRASAITTRVSGISALATGKTQAIAATADGKLRIFDANAEVVAEMTPPAHVQSIGLTSDDKLIVTGDRLGDLAVWNAQKPQAQALSQVEAHSGQIDALSVAGDSASAIVASGGRDGLLKLWRINGGELVEVCSLRAARSTFKRIAFSADGSRLFFFADGDMAARVLDVAAFRSACRERGLDW